MIRLYPREAIIAVTLNCNSRCVMCDIWKNKILKEVAPTFYRKLPSSLREINITGGEPFLRNDLPEIIKNIKIACPKARLLINTNGYLVNQIKKQIPQILAIDKNVAFRVSLDGWGSLHDEIRRLPNFFQKAMESIDFLKKSGIKDLGISFTLMEINKKQLLKVYNYCQQNQLEFSLTVATDSPIYFGKEKKRLRPKPNTLLCNKIRTLIKLQYAQHAPKSWARAWFNEQLYRFILSEKRALRCNAGNDFFYLDSLGNIYVCHLKPWLLGNLRNAKFENIYFSKKAETLKKLSHNCNECWMICSARKAIKDNLLMVLKDAIIQKSLSLIS